MSSRLEEIDMFLLVSFYIVDLSSPAQERRQGSWTEILRRSKDCHLSEPFPCYYSK